MQLVPEWAPGIHPMLVHFPIVLVTVALLFDFLGCVPRGEERLRLGATLLYGLGAISAIVVFFTGRSAGDAVMLDGAASVALTDHADWAVRTVWFLGVFVTIRVALPVFAPSRWTKRIAWVLILTGAVAAIFVQQTAERGAKLVFLHGVGVQAKIPASLPVEDPRENTGHSALLDLGAGGWRWTPNSSDPGWPLATLSGAQPVPDSQPGTFTFSSDRPGIFVAPWVSQNVQVDAELDLSDFAGTVQVIHHVGDAATYEFFGTAGDGFSQGYVLNGVSVELDRSAGGATPGVIVIRGVTDLTHRRGYLNGELITHGHGDAPGPGMAGLRLSGVGTIRILRLGVTPLRNPVSGDTSAEPPAAAAAPDHSH